MPMFSIFVVEVGNAWLLQCMDFTLLTLAMAIAAVPNMECVSGQSKISLHHVLMSHLRFNLDDFMSSYLILYINTELRMLLLHIHIKFQLALSCLSTGIEDCL